MSKPSASSTLYRLIEAGQLAHKALLVPVLERGLEPGDDAVLFVLAERRGATEAMIAAELDLGSEATAIRVARLIERDLIARRAIGPELAPGLALTERGERIRMLLVENWNELENALFGELKRKKQKWLAATLQRFVDLELASVAFGLAFGGAWHTQTFESDRVAPARGTGGLSFGGILSAERHLGAGLALRVEGGPLSELLPQAVLDREQHVTTETRWATPLTWWLAGGLVWRR